MPTDAELLARYCASRDERAFAELVRRHLALVYGAALRRSNGRHQLAEDVTQKVFCDLARKAASLRRHPILSGWLYQSTRFATIHALRTESRREKVAQAFATMPDTSPDAGAEWAQLRPVLDEAMDQLKEGDREAMILRYFEGLSFAEVGVRLRLSENAARMRTERALDKLRLQLSRRGVTSTTAALGLLLANQAVAAPPSGLATSVVTAAVATPPAGVLVTFFTHYAMNNLVLGTLSAAAAAALTTAAWSAFGNGTSNSDLAAAYAENVRLTRVASTGAGAAAVAAEMDTNSSAILRSAEQRLAKKAPTQHHDQGLATPRDAFLSYVWAADSGNVQALAAIFTYDEAGQQEIKRIHSAMPESVRQQYRTPEEFIAFVFIAGMLLHPMPNPEEVEKKLAAGTQVDLGPGRVGIYAPGKKSGPIFVQTSTGWRMLMDTKSLERSVNRVLSNETLAKLSAI
jgi:RNA polymerase sigma factor (sigma-70 family)